MFNFNVQMKLIIEGEPKCALLPSRVCEKSWIDHIQSKENAVLFCKLRLGHFSKVIPLLHNSLLLTTYYSYWVECDYKFEEIIAIPSICSKFVSRIHRDSEAFVEERRHDEKYVIFFGLLSNTEFVLSKHHS